MALPSVTRRARTRVLLSRPALLIGLIVVLGSLVRLYRLDAISLSLDEIGQVMVAQHPLGGGFLAGVAAHAGAAPLDYLGVKLAASLFGTSTLAVRLWPWLVGSLAVPALAWLAWESFRSPRIVVVSASLLAVAPFHVYYSREVRFWALSVLLSIVVLAIFAGAVRRRSARWWAAFGLVLAVGLYGHYFVAFAALACMLGFGITSFLGTAGGASLARSSRAAAGLGLGLLTAGVAFLPWYVYAVAPQLEPGLASGTLPPLTLVRADQIISGVLFPVPIPPTGVAGMTVIRSLELFALIGLLAAFRHPAVLAVGLLAIGILPAVWVADVQAGYFFHARQIAMLVPCVALLASAGIATVVRVAMETAGRWRSLVKGASIAAGWALLATSALPLADVYAGSIQTKEDWRGAAEFVARSACHDARILVNVGDTYRHGLAFYEPQLESQIEYVRPDPTLVETMRRTELHARDWFVALVYVPATGNVEQLVRDVTDRGYELHRFTWLLLVFEPHETCARPQTGDQQSR